MRARLTAEMALPSPDKPASLAVAGRRHSVRILAGPKHTEDDLKALSHNYSAAGLSGEDSTHWRYGIELTEKRGVQAQPGSAAAAGRARRTSDNATAGSGSRRGSRRDMGWSTGRQFDGSGSHLEGKMSGCGRIGHPASAVRPTMPASRIAAVTLSHRASQADRLASAAAPRSHRRNPCLTCC